MPSIKFPEARVPSGKTDEAVCSKKKKKSRKDNAQIPIHPNALIANQKAGCEWGDKCAFVHARKSSDDRTPKSKKGTIARRFNIQESRFISKNDGSTTTSRSILREIGQHSHRKQHNAKFDIVGRHWGLSTEAPSQHAIPVPQRLRKSVKNGRNVVKNNRSWRLGTLPNTLTKSLGTIWRT